MLTKAQIQRMAQRNGVGMQVQERDYLQHLILWLLTCATWRFFAGDPVGRGKVKASELVHDGGNPLGVLRHGEHRSTPQMWAKVAFLPIFPHIWG
jgi:hypothetical protein